MFAGNTRRGRLLAALFPLILLASGALADEKPCTIHDGRKYYDLNPLKSSKDYQVKIPNGQTLSLNVCQGVKTEMFGLKDDIDAGDVGGFIRRGHGDFVIGKVNTTLSVFDSKPRFVLSEGSRCKSKTGSEPVDIRASSLVEFICDGSIVGPGIPRVLAQLPPGDDEASCAFVIEWRTQYACHTSEGGIWGFFGTLAVIFLVLLMSYTVLGTLYNRFVLDLRGFDQIPQFSIESMKYHGREAYEWTRDMIGIIVLNMGGQSGGGGFSSNNPRTPNPVSHQAQVSGFGTDDLEGANDGPASSGLGNTGGFIRPQPGRDRSAAFQRHETNPVSHQSQVAQSLSFSSAPPTPSKTASPPPQIREAPSTRKSGAESRGSTREERDFMLGEDDEDAEELVDVKAPPLLAENPAVAAPTAPSPASSTTIAGSSSQNPAAAARGRDLGDDNTTLL